MSLLGIGPAWKHHVSFWFFVIPMKSVLVLICSTLMLGVLMFGFGSHSNWIQQINLLCNIYIYIGSSFTKKENTIYHYIIPMWYFSLFVSFDSLTWLYGGGGIAGLFLKSMNLVGSETIGRNMFGRFCSFCSLVHVVHDSLYFFPSPTQLVHKILRKHGGFPLTLQSRISPHTPGRYQKDPSPNSFWWKLFRIVGVWWSLGHLPRVCGQNHWFKDSTHLLRGFCRAAQGMMSACLAAWRGATEEGKVAFRHGRRGRCREAIHRMYTLENYHLEPQQWR